MQQQTRSSTRAGKTCKRLNVAVIVWRHQGVCRVTSVPKKLCKASEKDIPTQ